jgi:L-lactate utilization protein LutC
MSIVTEQKFLSEEEKTLLLEIRQNTQSLIAELGEIELIKLQLEDRHDSAKTFLNELKTKEQEFTKSVFDKYGKVNVNPETGEITPMN